MIPTKALWQRSLPYLMFMAVFACHAAYLSRRAAKPADGWADVGVGSGGMGGLESYLQAQEFYLGFSYALGAAFATWAALAYLGSRQASVAAGAAGSVTLVGVLLGAGCFLTGCCGSPMLGVYLALFGAKALGVGKPMTACLTALSVGGSYWFLSRRLSKANCGDSGCGCR